MLLSTWLLAAIIASVASAEELKWQEHINQYGNFRALMPGKLIDDKTRFDDEIEGSDDQEMRVLHSVFKSGESGASFMAMSIKHSAKFLAKYTPAERIDFLLDREISAFREKSPDVEFELHREPRVVQGYSGEYMRIKLPGPELWESHTVAFYAGEILYQAEVIVASRDSKSVLSPSDIDKFLSSFSVLAKTFEMNDTVTAISSTTDGRTVVLGTRGGLASFWDSQTGLPRHHYQIAKGHWDGTSENYPELKVAISPDGKQLLTGSAQGSVKLWDVATGKQIRELGNLSRRMREVAISADGQLALAHSSSGVTIWQNDSGQRVGHFDVDEHEVKSFAVSPDGSRLLLKLADISDWSKGGFQVFGIRDGKRLFQVQHSYPRGAAFGPDGKTLATASGTDLRIWDIDTGRELRRLDSISLHGDATARIAFSSDGKLLGVAGSTYDQVNARIWNLADYRVVDEFKRQTTHYITSLSFTPDNQWVLATGVGDERAFVYPLKLELAKPESLDLRPTGPQHDKAAATGERGRPRERQRERPTDGKVDAEVNGNDRGEVRTWTNSVGTRTVRAEFLGGDKESVTLRLENGKITTLPASEFSELDRKFVREMLASRERAENSETDQSAKAPAVATAHLLNGRLRSGAVMTGRAKQPGFGMWACRLEIVNLQGNSFQGVLYLDTAKVGRAEARVGASLDVDGLISGQETVQFTVRRIRSRSVHPDIVLGDDNIGLSYRGIVRGNRIVGHAGASSDAKGGGISMEFALTPAKVVALNKVTPSTQPRTRLGN